MIRLPPYVDSCLPRRVLMAHFMLQPRASTATPKQWARALRTVLKLDCGHTRAVGADVREAKEWPCLQCPVRP